VNTQNRNVSAHNGLTNKGQKDRRVVANVSFSPWDGVSRDDFGYTLQYVIFVLAPLFGWVGWHAHEDSSSSAA
jgi:hypothetical protein